MTSRVNLKGDDTPPSIGPTAHGRLQQSLSRVTHMKSDVRSSPLPSLAPKALLHISRFRGWRELSFISRS